MREKENSEFCRIMCFYALAREMKKVYPFTIGIAHAL
jgi:hypothetical protein